MRPVHVDLARFAGEGPCRVIFAVVKPRDRRDLGKVTGQEDLIGRVNIVKAEHGLDDLMAGGAQIGDMTGAGDARQEGAIGDRGEIDPVAHDEDIGRRRFGDIAVAVGDQRVVKALGPRLDQHPCIIGVKAAGLGVTDRIGHDRAVKAGAGQRQRQLGIGHRLFFEADRKGGGVLRRCDADIRAVDCPIHRPDIDRLTGAVRLQPRFDQRDHLFGRDRGGDHQRLGRAVDPGAMQIEIGGDAVEIAGTVKDRRSLPNPMICGAHDGDISLMPFALPECADIGAESHFLSFDRC